MDELRFFFRYGKILGLVALVAVEIFGTPKRRIRFYVHLYIYVYVCSATNTISRLALGGETFCMHTI